MAARRKPSREKKPREMSRRQFLWTAAAAGGAFAGFQAITSRRSGRGSPDVPNGPGPKPSNEASSTGSDFRDFKSPNNLKPGLAVARGADHFKATAAALEALGGMGRLVSADDLVCVKPNISWDREPKYANNTNPEVVAAVVEAALKAGAREVRVFDYPISSQTPQRTYTRSGIRSAVERVSPDGRARMVYVAKNEFVVVPIPGGVEIKQWSFYRPALECDVFINVPVLKQHPSSRLTIGLKSLFGVIADPRGKLHGNIHHTIVDLNRVIRTDLTVLDATRVLMRGGPSGRLLHNVKKLDTGVAGTDRVAVDAYGAKLFGSSPKRVGFIRNADGVLEIPGGAKGTMDYEKRGVIEMDV